MNIKLVEFSVTDPLPLNFPVYGSVGFVDYVKEHSSIFVAGDVVVCPIRASLGRATRELYVNYTFNLFANLVSSLNVIILNHVWGYPNLVVNDLNQLMASNQNFVLVLVTSLEDLPTIKQLGAGSFYTTVVTYDALLNGLRIV